MFNIHKKHDVVSIRDRKAYIVAIANKVYNPYDRSIIIEIRFCALIGVTRLFIPRNAHHKLRQRTECHLPM